jgi:hypothetical protein
MEIVGDPEASKLLGARQPTGMSECHENDDFEHGGTNNCRFFGPKSRPQNDSYQRPAV